MEAICTINIHTGQNVFCSYHTFEGLWVVSFQTKLKFVVYFGLYVSSLRRERENQINTAYDG